VLEFLKFNPKRPAQFLLFLLLLPQQFKDQVERKLDFKSLFLVGSLNSGWFTLSLMMMKLSKR
jgi:hypothetical protein